MLVKKVCMIGAFSVGKTSLVEQYVHTIFTDRYLSTVGVKISKKRIAVDSRDVELIIWDMEGKDDFVDVNIPYLRGAMGLFLVVDGTRVETLDMALHLQELIRARFGDIPLIMMLNKADMTDNWELDEERIADLHDRNVPFLLTSAKTGQNVENAFEMLARAMLQR